MATFLFVHGAFHGAWCWERLLPHLEARGHRAEAVELPFTSPADDTAAVVAALERLAADGDPISLVGHSLGGVVVTAAAARARPAQIVYLAAVMMDPARPVEIPASVGMAALRAGPESTSVDPELATEAFYHRCDPADAAWATALLRPMPNSVLGAAAPDPSAWADTATAYIICTEDRIMDPTAQRAMAAQADRRVEIDSDHSPFLACPDRLAETLEELLAT